MSLNTVLPSPVASEITAPVSDDYFKIDHEYASPGPPVDGGDVSYWLLTAGRAIAIENATAMFDELCWRVCAQGVPLWRATLHVGTLHPQIRGYGMRWWRQRRVTERFHIARGSEESEDFIKSPIRAAVEQGKGLRLNLEAAGDTDYPLLNRLRREGATEYIAAPLNLVTNRYPVVTWATDTPGGFSEAALAHLEALRPGLAAVVEARTMRLVAGDLLQTYLGRQVGQRILEGHILRGHGERMRAVVMCTDLRGFTRLSDQMPGEVMIEMLDDYFDQVTQPVHAAGGEVLKFMGDGVLAIFPIEDGGERHAARNGLAVASEIIARLDRINAVGADEGRPALRIGIGLHLGELIYGNVGAADRLDFTVIGPAVNLTSRLEGLTKRFGRPILTSSAFAAAYPTPLLSLGFQPVRGLAEPEEVFGLPDA